MERQAILERLGWRFVRIRGSHYYRDPTGVMREVFERLNALGITPSLRLVSPIATSDFLHERVIARAAELQAEWAGRKAGEKAA
jgi:hypothetical protein